MRLGYKDQKQGLEVKFISRSEESSATKISWQSNDCSVFLCPGLIYQHVVQNWVDKLGKQPRISIDKRLHICLNYHIWWTHGYCIITMLKHTLRLSISDFWQNTIFRSGCIQHIHPITLHVTFSSSPHWNANCEPALSIWIKLSSPPAMSCFELSQRLHFDKLFSINDRKE